jgi:hypothetical protein
MPQIVMNCLGGPYDQSAYDACLRDSIAKVVRQQAEAGVDIASDGEFGKTDNWAWYIHQRISGFSERPATPEKAQDPLRLCTGPLHSQSASDHSMGEAESPSRRRQDRERAVVGPDVCYFVRFNPFSPNRTEGLL